MRFIDDDIIFTIDEPRILALLQPQFGLLTDLRLFKGDDGFTWHAFNVRGHTVFGTITIRMTPAPEGIKVWLETGAVGAPAQSSTISRRVASRFARERGGADEVPSESLNLILADGGVVTARDVERLLVPQFGKLTRLGFKASPIGALVAPNAVAWEAVGSEGERVEGALVLHAALANDHVELWAEITVNRRRGAAAKSASEHDPRARLEEVGQLARDMIARIREQPTVPWIEVVAGLVRIVEVAESDDE